MNPAEERWAQELQHNRDEARKLMRINFTASIVFALIGFSLIAAVLYWAKFTALDAIKFGGLP